MYSVYSSYLLVHALDSGYMIQQLPLLLSPASQEELRAGSTSKLSNSTKFHGQEAIKSLKASESYDSNEGRVPRAMSLDKRNSRDSFPSLQATLQRSL